MTHNRKFARVAFLATLCLVAVFTIANASRASIGSINKGDLNGAWQITLTGNTGCGLSSMLVNATLTNGTGPATIQTHGQCGDSTVTGQTFTINSITANGSASGGLSCGTGCGWALKIQVSPDRSTMNLADVDPTNPNNFIAGMGVHQ